MTEKEQMREWVRIWKQAGPELERIRIEEMRASTPVAFVRATSRLSEVLKHQGVPPRTSSGFVEFQHWVRKFREQDKMSVPNSFRAILRQTGISRDQSKEPPKP